MRHLLLVALLVSSAGDLVLGLGVASTGLARSVTRLLQSEPLTAFAAADPESRGRFVAVLYVPTQLLVVEAAHPDVATIETRIAAGRYRDVYLDLHGSPSPDQRFFVLDVDADGLLASPPNDGGVDVVYDGDMPPLLLNGDLESHRRSRQVYDAAVAAADAQYSHALRVLESALEGRAGTR